MESFRMKAITAKTKESRDREVGWSDLTLDTRLDTINPLQTRLFSAYKIATVAIRHVEAYGTSLMV